MELVRDNRLPHLRRRAAGAGVAASHTVGFLNPFSAPFPAAPPGWRAPTRKGASGRPGCATLLPFVAFWFGSSFLDPFPQRPARAVLLGGDSDAYRHGNDRGFA